MNHGRLFRVALHLRNVTADASLGLSVFRMNFLASAYCNRIFRAFPVTGSGLFGSATPASRVCD
jgi:hypothetical protein